MPKKIGLLVALISVCACTPDSESVAPATVDATTTAEETKDFDTIVGIQLGAATKVQECSKERAHGMVLYSVPPKAYPCFRERSAGNTMKVADDWDYGPEHEGMREVILDPATLPHGVDTKARFLTIGTAIEAVDLTTEPDSQEDLLRLLVAKYGKPVHSNVATMQNALGASFDSINATWKFQSMEITFIGRIDLDSGLIAAKSPSGVSWLASRAEPRADGF